MIIIPGDFVKFNNKLYTVVQDREGNPLLQRYYRNSMEMLEEKKQKLESTINRVNVNVALTL